MSYQITREGSEHDGYEVRMVGEFFPYEFLGSKYIGHMSDASSFMTPDTWAYVPVIGERQLPQIYISGNNLEGFLQCIAELNDEHSKRSYNAAKEAAEWAWYLSHGEWTNAETTEFSSLNDD